MIQLLMTFALLLFTEEDELNVDPVGCLLTSEEDLVQDVITIVEKTITVIMVSFFITNNFFGLLIICYLSAVYRFPGRNLFCFRKIYNLIRKPGKNILTRPL